MKPFIIGVDGGGTKTKAVLYSPEGEVLASSQAGPSNVTTDIDKAALSIKTAIHDVLSRYFHEQANIDVEILTQDCALSIGCAGAEVGERKRQLKKQFTEYRDCQVFSDLEIACMGANNGETCGLIITGTGSSIARFESGELSQFGGHGFVLGDHASGAWLGKQLLTEYLLYLDGISDADPMFMWLEEMIGTHKHAVVERFACATPMEFANIGTEVFTYVTDSPLAGDLVEEGFMYLSSQIEQHLAGIPVFISGGLADFYLPLLRRYGVTKMEREPCYGAFMMAKHGAR